jgi:hypothetical protein
MVVEPFAAMTGAVAAIGIAVWLPGSVPGV